MDVSGKCRLPETTTTLERLWRVLVDEHAADQLERHLILLDTYLSMTGGTVWLEDLQLLTRVTAVFADKAQLQAGYREPLNRILDLLKQPFSMRKASDEVSFKHYIIEFFTTLGCILLKTKSKYIKSNILGIIEGILYTERVEQSGLTPLRACVAGVEVSEFVECLADFISTADEDIYQWVIYTALQISTLSRLSCWTLLTRGVVESLLVRLTTAHEERRAEVLDVTYQLLWRLLGCTSHPQDWPRVPRPSLIALRSLRYVLREEAIVHAHPGHYNNGLNNVSALTLKLMHLFPDAEYVLSGLIEDITFLATLTESVIAIHILPRFKSTQDHLQFKKLMLACLSLSPITSTSLTIFDQYKVAECLVAMMSGVPCGSMVSWTVEHMLELFQCALPVVCALFDDLCQSFIDAELMVKLTLFLKVHFDEKHLSEDLTLTVIKTITSICFRKKNSKAIHDALKKADTVPTLLNLSKIILERGLPLTLRTQTMLSHILSILASLMENELELQNLHAATCISIVNSLYQRIINPLPTDSLTDNRLTVAASNFAWEAIVWNNETSAMFFESGNVFSHIDILEKSPFSVQLVYLSVLADLSEYEQCVPYLISWRGREGVKLLSLLCRIWRAEEERFKVSRTKNGCITDIEKPIMGKNQADAVKSGKKNVISVRDVFGSVRPKIYAIFQLLRRHMEVKDISEEHYRLGHDKLPYPDLITLKIVEAYLPLKMGEVWWEIRAKQEKVMPLDRYLAETLVERYLNWSLSVQRSQGDVMKSWEASERDEEERLYSLMRSDRLCSALAALRELEMIARSADREQQVRAHRRLCEGIQRSRASGDADFRVTYPRGLSIMLISSQADVKQRAEPDLVTTRTNP